MGSWLDNRAKVIKKVLPPTRQLRVIPTDKWLARRVVRSFNVSEVRLRARIGLGETWCNFLSPNFNYFSKADY